MYTLQESYYPHSPQSHKRRRYTIFWQNPFCSNVQTPDIIPIMFLQTWMGFCPWFKESISVIRRECGMGLPCSCSRWWCSSSHKLPTGWSSRCCDLPSSSTSQTISTSCKHIINFSLRCQLFYKCVQNWKKTSNSTIINFFNEHYISKSILHVMRNDLFQQLDLLLPYLNSKP